MVFAAKVSGASFVIVTFIFLVPFTFVLPMISPVEFLAGPSTLPLTAVWFICVFLSRSTVEFVEDAFVEALFGVGVGETATFPDDEQSLAFTELTSKVPGLSSLHLLLEVISFGFIPLASFEMVL